MRNARSTKELIELALGGKHRWEDSPNSLPNDYLIGLIERCGSECLEAGEDLADFSRYCRKWFHFYRPSCLVTEELTIRMLAKGWRLERLDERYPQAEHDILTGRNPFAVANLERDLKVVRRDMMRAGRKYIKLDQENRRKAG